MTPEVKILGRLDTDGPTPAHAVRLGDDAYVYEVSGRGYYCRKAGEPDGYGVSCVGPRATWCDCKGWQYRQKCRHAAGAEELLRQW